VSKSEIKNSPNIGGDATSNHFGDNYFSLVVKNKSIQVRTITNLILLIGNTPRSLSREETDKDLEKKLRERFSEYKEQLETRYAELLIDYSNSYEEAKKNAGVSEVVVDKIASYLMALSRRCLDEAKDNPVTAINLLLDHFRGELNKELADRQEEYDDCAIEFFIYKELIKCNVFPNPVR